MANYGTLPSYPSMSSPYYPSPSQDWWHYFFPQHVPPQQDPNAPPAQQQPPPDPWQPQQPNRQAKGNRLSSAQQMQQYGMQLMNPQMPGQASSMPYGLAPTLWANPNQGY